MKNHTAVKAIPRPRSWGLIGELLLRGAGLALVVGVICYMSGCYLNGQYLKGDPVLTLTAIMAFVVGAVFSLYCTAVSVRERARPGA